MSLAQVWMHSIEFPSKPFFAICLNFQQQYSLKFNNIVHILSLKITKSKLLNQTRWVLSNNTKNFPKFQYSFQFWFSFKNFDEKMVQ